MRNGVFGVPCGIPSHVVRKFRATALNMELSLLLFVGSIWVVHNITKGAIYRDVITCFFIFFKCKNDDLMFDY